MQAMDAPRQEPSRITNRPTSTSMPKNKRRTAILAALREANTNPPEPIQLLAAEGYGSDLINGSTPSEANAADTHGLTARKKALRKIMRARRRALAARPDGSASALELWHLIRRFAATDSPEDSPSTLPSLIAYEALPGELSFARFLETTSARIWLPIIASANGTPLSELPVGFISEDEAATLRVTCSLVIVPALAVDEGGARLGQGGGWYDRALPEVLDASPDALVFAATPRNAYLRSGIIPVEAHDMQVDGVVTEQGWRVF